MDDDGLPALPNINLLGCCDVQVLQVSFELCASGLQIKQGLQSQKRGERSCTGNRGWATRSCAWLRPAGLR